MNSHSPEFAFLGLPLVLLAAAVISVPIARFARLSAIVAYLAQKKIPLELCVLSNVCTGIVPDVAHHPARLYYDQGIPLSVNTDDPKMFGNSLAEEYAAVFADDPYVAEDAAEIVSEHLVAGRPVERLRLPDTCINTKTCPHRA